MLERFEAKRNFCKRHLGMIYVYKGGRKNLQHIDNYLLPPVFRIPEAGLP
jgi:hypothetical protein